MAHLIDRMMYAGAVPWHGLGISLPETCDSDRLRELVFNWTADKRKLFMRNEAGATPSVEVTDYVGLVRSDNGGQLAVVSREYGVVQYADALSLLDAASVSGQTKYITAGTLDSGRRAWALATIPSATREVAGSEIKPYLLLSTSHDGTLALQCQFTPVYVVCNNTLTAALGSSNKNKISLKHTKNVTARLAVVKELVQNATAYFGAFSEQALTMARTQYSEQSFRQLVATLFPVPAKATTAQEQFDSAAAEAQRATLRLFQGGQKAANNAPGTTWAAFNAVTEFIDHHQRRKGADEYALAENRFAGTMFGNGAAIRQKALDMLIAA